MPYLGSPHYPYQRIAPQANAEGHQPLFPKPIYSYRYISKHNSGITMSKEGHWES